MTKQEAEILEKKLGVFGVRLIQDLLTLLTKMEMESITIQEVRDYNNHRLLEIEQENKKLLLEANKKLKKAQKEWEVKAPKCPECGSPLYISPVNVNKRTMTGDDSLSVWSCYKCHYQEFLKERVEDIIKQLNLLKEGNQDGRSKEKA